MRKHSNLIYIPCRSLCVKDLTAEFTSHRDELIDSVKEVLDNGTKVS